MKILAIIPARGGSKRIKRKNIRDFAGKPVIAYSIEAALRSGCFDTVMVSTDDDGIAEVALSCGADVPFMRSGGGISTLSLAYTPPRLLSRRRVSPMPPRCSGEAMLRPLSLAWSIHILCRGRCVSMNRDA